VTGLLDLVPILESNQISERDRVMALGAIVSLIAGSLICFATGYRSIDEISLKYHQQTPLLFDPAPESDRRVSLKRKSEHLSLLHPQSGPTAVTQSRRSEILNTSHELLSVPLSHLLAGSLSLAHSNPNQITREHKQVRRVSLFLSLTLSLSLTHPLSLSLDPSRIESDDFDLHSDDCPLPMYNQPTFSSSLS
jgi:hypothetical protein